MSLQKKISVYFSILITMWTYLKLPRVSLNRPRNPIPKARKLVKEPQASTK